MTCDKCKKTLSYSGGCNGEWEHLDGSVDCSILDLHPVFKKAILDNRAITYYTTGHLHEQSVKHKDEK